MVGMDEYHAILLDAILEYEVFDGAYLTKTSAHSQYLYLASRFAVMFVLLELASVNSPGTCYYCCSS